MTVVYYDGTISRITSAEPGFVRLEISHPPESVKKIIIPDSEDARFEIGDQVCAMIEIETNIVDLFSNPITGMVKAHDD